MRGMPSQYQVVVANSIEHALKELHSNHLLQPLAGGTDFMVEYNAGKRRQDPILDLSRLNDLRGIKQDADVVRIGALTTYSDIINNPVMNKSFPNLVAAGQCSGCRAIQNRGTLGGNIMNASPAADSVPALISYHAIVEFQSIRGIRTVPIHSLYQGYHQLDHQPDELLVAIRLPRPKSERFHFYRKVGTRKAQAITKVGLAWSGTIQSERFQEIGLGLSSVGPIVASCPKTIALLKTINTSDWPRHWPTIAQSLKDEIQPIDDIRSTGDYRSYVATSLLRSALTESLGFPVPKA